MVGLRDHVGVVVAWSLVACACGSATPSPDTPSPDTPSPDTPPVASAESEPDPCPPPDDRPLAPAVTHDPLVTEYAFEGDDGVGKLAIDFRINDRGARPTSFRTFARAHAATVVVMRDTECPISRRTGPKLARLEQELREQDVQFLYVNVSTQDTAEEIAQEIESYGFGAPYFIDPDARSIGTALQLTTTTEVFVFDRAATLRYRGAIDDQFGVTYSRREANHEYLRDAVRDVVAARPVRTPRTVAEGCVLSVSTRPGPRPAPTYHGRISRILGDHCVECHHDGSVAPFVLDTYEAVSPRRQMLRLVVERGIMPPFGAEPTEYGLAHDPRLSEPERADLLAWIEAGGPRGDAREAPVAYRWSDDWPLGPPDQIIAYPAQDVPADGVLDYVTLVMETGLTEGRWIRAIDVRPTQPQVVHHNAVSYTGQAASSFLHIYVPGRGPQVTPPGTAHYLPAGARIVANIHYTPNGVATSDVEQIGLYFADEPPEHPILGGSTISLSFEIPAHANHYPITAEYRLPTDAQIIAASPHMHLRGQASRLVLVTPDGEETELFNIPRFDFNWQLEYELARPVVAPRGSVLRHTNYYNNSDTNPANPDPNSPVRFGFQTWDEMSTIYLTWVPLNATGDNREMCLDRLRVHEVARISAIERAAGLPVTAESPGGTGAAQHPPQTASAQ